MKQEPYTQMQSENLESKSYDSYFFIKIASPPNLCARATVLIDSFIHSHYIVDLWSINHHIGIIHFHYYGLIMYKFHDMHIF